MAQQGYIFGKGTPDTYESLQAKRRTAERFGLAAMRTPQNLGEGLSALGQAIAYRRLMNQADAGDAAGRAAYDEKRSSVLGALMGRSLGGTPGFNPGAPMPVTANPAGLDPSIIAAVDRVDPQGREAEIRSGLIERGMPPHIADGFVMNFKDESGLDPGINEAKPIVPGSRGGFGLAQWTGPRRVALEKFAAARGAAPSDAKVQMDFLMAELQGPESSAARNIFAAPDAGSAAAAIATDFLRPAPEHLKRRVAEYTGGQISPGASIPAIMEIMADPYAPEGDKMVLGALLEQQLAQMQPPDPMQALEMQYKQAQIDQMRNPQTDPMRALEMEYKRAQIDQMRNPQANADVPAGYRELQLRAESSGLLPGSPEYQQFMLTGGGGIGESKPAQFEALHLQAMAAGLTEGTPEYKQFMLTKGAGDAALARTMAEAKGAATAAAPTQIANADIALKGIADLRNSDGLDWGTGASSMLTVPGTAAYGFAAQVEQLKGGAFLTAIEQLQGLGALSNAEGTTATAAVARLDRAQSKEDFLKALDDYEAIVKTGRARAERNITVGAAPAPGLSPEDMQWLEGN